MELAPRSLIKFCQTSSSRGFHSRHRSRREAESSASVTRKSEPELPRSANQSSIHLKRARLKSAMCSVTASDEANLDRDKRQNPNQRTLSARRRTLQMPPGMRQTKIAIERLQTGRACQDTGSTLTVVQEIRLLNLTAKIRTKPKLAAALRVCH